MLFYKIIAGSSVSVPAIQSDSVHLIVTSPPYLTAKDYDIDNPENIGNYGEKDQLIKIRPIYEECFRVLRSGRKMVVNVPDMVKSSDIDGKVEHFQLFEKTVNLLKEIGFVYESPFAWFKNHSLSKNLMGSWPYPGGVILGHDFEPCAIMRKPGTPDYSNVTGAEREASKMTTAFMNDAIYNTLHVKGESTVDFHIASYPVELPYRFIGIFSFVGEVIYDPFLGSGTTLLAAKKLNRSGIGCEIGFKTPDGLPWIEHVQDRIGWDDGSLYGEQILYEIVDPEGKILKTSMVQGRGKLEKKILEVDSSNKLSNFHSENVDEQKVELETNGSKHERHEQKALF